MDARTADLPFFVLDQECNNKCGYKSQEVTWNHNAFVNGMGWLFPVHGGSTAVKQMTKKMPLLLGKCRLGVCTSIVKGKSLDRSVPDAHSLQIQNKHYFQPFLYISSKPKNIACLQSTEWDCRNDNWNSRTECPRIWTISAGDHFDTTKSWEAYWQAHPTDEGVTNKGDESTWSCLVTICRKDPVS